MKQGPLHEVNIVKDLKKLGLAAKRIDKSGDSGAASDIQVGTPSAADPVVLIWKRFIGEKLKGRRRTKTVVVMDYRVWKALIWMAGWSHFWIEAKASQSESVTTVLEKAEKKVEELG